MPNNRKYLFFWGVLFFWFSAISSVPSFVWYANDDHCIPQVGKAMSSNESAAYEIMKSLDVDYVLIIFGGVIGYSGDDINKFLWMVRIAEGEHPKDIRVSHHVGFHFHCWATGSRRCTFSKMVCFVFRRATTSLLRGNFEWTKPVHRLYLTASCTRCLTTVLERCRSMSSSWSL